MSFSTMKIGTGIITFDKEKTHAHCTEYNAPCECAYCQNYYKHITNNQELVEFLNGFGVDFYRADEIFSWDIDKKADLIQYEGYYSVFGRIEGDDFKIKTCGVNVSFLKDAAAPCDKVEDYFWICVECTFENKELK